MIMVDAIDNISSVVITICFAVIALAVTVAAVAWACFYIKEKIEDSKWEKRCNEELYDKRKQGF